MASDFTERKHLEEALRQKNIELDAAIQTERRLGQYQEEV